MKQFISNITSRCHSQKSNAAILTALSAVILSTVFLISSCRKNQEAVVIPSTAPLDNSHSAPYDPAWDPSNKKNPFDAVGALHNLLLDSAQAYIDRTGDTTRKSIHEKIAQVFHGAVGINPRLSLSKVDPAVDYGIAAHSEKYLDSYKMPLEIKGYLDRLWSIINAVQDADYPILKGKITKLEDEIIGDRSLSEDGRRLLLSTTSVARYSSAHWISWALGNNELVFTMGLFQAVKAAMKAGMADAAAMVIGYLIKLPYDVITDMSAAVSSIVYHNLMDR